MKLCKKIGLCLLAVAAVLLCVIALPTTAQAADVSDLQFKLTGDKEGYYVSKCRSTATGELIIPDTYNGLPVTKIGWKSFENCNGLTSIIIPDSVTSVTYYAFESCDSLRTVILGNNVREIDNAAFWLCWNLRYNHFGGGAYLGTSDNPYFALLKITDNYPEIHQDTKVIGDSALEGCELSNITIPDNVISINDRAFMNSKWLTTVNIGSGVTSIGESVFYDCDSLTSITIPDNVISIGEKAFGNCTSLTSAIYCGTQEQWKAIQIGNYNDDLIRALKFHNYENNVCTVCKAFKPCEHDWMDATCVAPKTCKLCQTTDGEALGHNMQQTADEIAPTCETVGKTAVLTCVNCGKVEGGAEIPAIGHDMKETAPAVEPTCTAAGKGAVLGCVNGCGKTEGGEEIPAKGHSFENDTCIVCGQGKFVVGDANGDGKVNLRDAILVLQASNGKDVAVDRGAADVTGDGKMNIRDAILILKRANGNKDPFPSEK